MPIPAGDPSWAPYTGGLGFGCLLAGLLGYYARPRGFTKLTGMRLEKGSVWRTPTVFVTRAPVWLGVGVALLVLTYVGSG